MADSNIQYIERVHHMGKIKFSVAILLLLACVPKMYGSEESNQSEQIFYASYISPQGELIFKKFSKEEVKRYLISWLECLSMTTKESRQEYIKHIDATQAVINQICLDVVTDELLWLELVGAVDDEAAEKIKDNECCKCDLKMTHFGTAEIEVLRFAEGFVKKELDKGNHSEEFKSFMIRLTTVSKNVSWPGHPAE